MRGARRRWRAPASRGSGSNRRPTPCERAALPLRHPWCVASAPRESDPVVPPYQGGAVPAGSGPSVDVGGADLPARRPVAAALYHRVPRPRAVPGVLAPPPPGFQPGAPLSELQDQVLRRRAGPAPPRLLLVGNQVSPLGSSTPCGRGVSSSRLRLGRAPSCRWTTAASSEAGHRTPISWLTARRPAVGRPRIGRPLRRRGDPSGTRTRGSCLRDRCVDLCTIGPGRRRRDSNPQRCDP